MDVALVDGDVLVYINGFAAQETWYTCEDEEVFPTLTQAKAHSEKVGIDPSTIFNTTVAEPKSHALKLVKNTLERIKDRTGTKKVRVFLSGKDNFREEVAVTRPYKGNRKQPKPLHYDNIREYLQEIWGAEVIDGMEADDALGINQTSDSCICTIDKDLDMVEGYHYNFQTDKFYTINPLFGIKQFYTQLLTGDTVDNIQGVPGIGKVKAGNLLRGMTDEEEMYWTVLCEYEKKYDRPYEVMLEMGKLLWILREEGKSWETKF